jgi:hypothetical protein
MSFENLTAELSLLVDEIEGDQGDRHEIYLRIREKLGELKAMGMPLPEDLVRLERNLEAEFDADMGYILYIEIDGGVTYLMPQALFISA